MSLSPLERSAAQAFAARLRELYPERLREVRVFGSRARREGRADSDLDVWVLLDRAPLAERLDIYGLATDLMLELDLPFPIAPLVMSAEQYADLHARERLLPREIDRDGIPV